MRIHKSIAIQLAIGATVVGTYFAVSSQADDMTINNPAPSPITEQVDVAQVPTPAPAVDAPASPVPEPVVEKVVPVPQQQQQQQQGAPRNPPPWTPIPLPPTTERQPASPPQGKRWQEGDGCDMSVQSCTAVDVMDPMPEGCYVYDQLNHVCTRWEPFM